MKIPQNKVLLIVLDGVGEGKNYPGNALKRAKTPFIDQIRRTYPTTLLKTDGNAVGLPQGFQGGSEVGHFTIGAGRIIWQSLEEINRSIKNGSFFQKKALLDAVKKVKKYHSALHLLGMISDEGVHAQIDHLFALLKLAKKHQLDKVFIHCITDGRDVPERSAKKYLKQIQHKIKKIGVGQITTIIGRYYAMDRDTNWNRTKKAYNLMVKGEGFLEKDPLKAVDHAYRRGDPTDYYLNPIILNQKGLVKNYDSIIFFNYRTDRARQLTQAFTAPKFKKFPTEKLKIHFVCFGPYSEKAPVVFPTPKIKNNLSEIFSKLRLKQLRIAETEKYAHVTFFFNSQIKKPFPGETRILINSPKVPSYAEKPEMSAYEVTKRLIQEIKKKKYHFIALNYANGDLVGHSGNLKATIKCCEVLNQCLSKVIPAAKKATYVVILTADHGNAEEMLYSDGSICPAHSTNPVACTLISEKFKKSKFKKGGGLKNLAPTILEIMKIKKPKEMTGESLILKL